MKEITVLGIDLAKTVFHLVGLNSSGTVVLKKRIYRDELSEYIANFPKTKIAMEACSGSHYWGRKFRDYGHEVRLIAPQFVKPYVKTNKNDMKDAEAIAEAASRPTMHFVPLKSEEQQDIQSLHRIRERLVGNRTAIGNQIRGLAGEYGIVFPKSIKKLLTNLAEALEKNKDRLSALLLDALYDLREEFIAVDLQIKLCEKKLELVAKDNDIVQRLLTIEGIGLITATALYAAVGNCCEFKSGRHLAAWLGLVPRQHSTGGKTVLLGISKRGDMYLRKLLIHGARSALRCSEKKSDYRNVWVSQLKERVGYNKAAVALANRNARTVWAVITKQEDYQLNFAAQYAYA